MKSKKLLVILGIICLGLVLFGLPFIGVCAKPAPSQAPETIRIGAINNMTGPVSSLGQAANWGYRVAVDDINKDGGLYVKEFDKRIPLELITMDMAASGEQAVSRMERLSGQNVVAVVGETWIAGAAGVAEKHGIPLLATMTASRSAHEQGYRYYFSPFCKTNNMAKGVFDLLDSIPKGQRPTKVAIVETQSDIGIDYCSLLKSEAVARGYDVAAYEKFTPFTRDLSPAIVSMKVAGAEVVMGIFMDPDGVTLMKQSKELAFNPKAIFIAQAADTQAWIKTLGKIGDYVVTFPDWHHALKFSGVAEINAKHQAEFGAPAEVYVGPAYASIQIIADAIERAGTLDREKVRDAIATTDMMTVRGQVKFRNDGTLMDYVPVMGQWQGGVEELVWAKEIRTKPLIYPMPRWEER